MQKIDTTKKLEGSVLPSLFQTADDIDEIETRANQLAHLLRITAEYTGQNDKDLTDAMHGLYFTLGESIDRLHIIALNVSIHDANNKHRESVAQQEANPGSVVPIKPRGRAPKGGAA